MSKKLQVCFDVDGTIIGDNDKPREEVIAMLKAMAKFCDVYVWSGGTSAYAKTWTNRLGLDKYIVGAIAKPTANMSGWVDLAIDDQPACKLGKTQIIV